MEMVIGYVIELASKYPEAAALFAVLYLVGLFFKVLREAADKFVLESPSKEDDSKWAEIKEGKIFKAAAWLADVLLRIKSK